MGNRFRGVFAVVLGLHKKYLYGNVGKSAKAFALALLVFGFVFITFYGFLKNPREFTASMIGLDFPWAFRGWGVFSTMAVFVNIMLMYNKYGFNRKGCVISASIGCAMLFVTINVPSFGEELVLSSLRCMSHWTGALGFAFLVAAPVVIFLFNMSFRKKNKKFRLLFFGFSATLLLMIILLVTVGKDGIIENIPMWAVYIVLFLVNYTDAFNQH